MRGKGRERRSRRAEGTNPRALGTNPRALGTDERTGRWVDELDGPTGYYGPHGGQLWPANGDQAEGRGPP